MEDNTRYARYERDMTKDLACTRKLCDRCYELLDKCPMCRTPYYRSDEIYYEFDDDDDYTFFEFTIDSFTLLLMAASVTFSLTCFYDIFFFF